MSRNKGVISFSCILVVLSLEAAHYQQQDQQDKANALLEKAIECRADRTLSIYREKLGNHPFTATILNNLSENYRALKKFDDALKCAFEALKIRRGFLGEHMETALSLFEVALVLKETGKLEGAKWYLEKCLVIQKKVLDEKNTDLER